MTWLIDFGLVIVQVLIFKVYAIIGFSKIAFFNFSGTEKVKQNQKNKIDKNHSKPPEFVRQLHSDKIQTF